MAAPKGNQYAKGCETSGRPAKYKTVDDMKALIIEYFNRQQQEGRPLTVTGLAKSLGMTRQMLIDYSNKDEFADTIKEAKMTIEEFSEETLYTARNPVGAIFNLKNNWGWKDKHEVDNNLSGGVTIKWEE